MYALLKIFCPNGGNLLGFPISKPRRAHKQQLYSLLAYGDAATRESSTAGLLLMYWEQSWKNRPADTYNNPRALSPTKPHCVNNSKRNALCRYCFPDSHNTQRHRARPSWTNYATKWGQSVFSLWHRADQIDAGNCANSHFYVVFNAINICIYLFLCFCLLLSVHSLCPTSRRREPGKFSVIWWSVSPRYTQTYRARFRSNVFPGQHLEG